MSEARLRWMCVCAGARGEGQGVRFSPGVCMDLGRRVGGEGEGKSPSVAGCIVAVWWEQPRLPFAWGREKRRKGWGRGSGGGVGWGWGREIEKKAEVAARRGEGKLLRCVGVG